MNDTKNTLTNTMIGMRSFVTVAITCLLLLVSPSAVDSRSLQVNGDWDSLNALLRDSLIDLPGSVIQQRVLGSTLTLYLDRILCGGTSVGDIRVDAEQESSANLKMNVDIVDVGIICRVAYRFEYILGSSGRGTVDVFARNTTAAAGLLLTSSDFEVEPVSNVTVTSCESAVDVYDLDFNNQGLFLFTFLLNAIERPLRSLVGREIGDFLCDFVNTVDELVYDSIEKLINITDPYRDYTLQDGSASLQNDPLSTERALVVPDNLVIMDFQNPSTDLAEAAVSLVEEASSFFEESNEDGSMRINSFIRENLLNDDGVYVFDLTSFIGSDGVLFDGTSSVGNLTLTLTNATISKLDSFTKFDFLKVIGNYTLDTQFALEGLVISVGAELALSAVGSTTSNLYIESVQFEVALGPISSSIPLLILVEEDKVGELPLGSVLQVDSVLDCMLQAVHMINVSSTSIDDIVVGKPQVKGFESPGMQRVSQIVVDVFYTSISAILPSAVGGLVQDTLVDFVDDAYANSRGDLTCNELTRGSETGIVDLRDLLLEEDQAKEFGASGDSPYGSVMALAKSLIDGQVSGSDEPSSVINTLILQLSESQSGIPGTLAFPDNLVDFEGEVAVGGLQAAIKLSMGNVTIENIDSISGPFSLLDPIEENPHRLMNSMVIGSAAQPFRVSVTALLSVSNDDVQSSNEVIFTLGLGPAPVSLDLLLRVVEKRMLEFPLEDILDVNCLLSMLETPSLSESGLRTEDSLPSLAFPSISLGLDEIDLSMACKDCSSPLVAEASELLESVEGQADAGKSARNLVNFVLSFFDGDRSLFQNRVDRIVTEAPKKCRHREEFDPAAPATEYEPILIEGSSSPLGFLFSMVIILFSIVCFAMGLGFLLRWIVKRRHTRWLHGLSSSQIVALYNEQSISKEIMAQVDEDSSSIFRSAEVPMVARYLVPLVIIGNIGLFLSGHLSVAGSIRIYLDLAGNEFAFEDFYTFSILETAIRLWNAGAQQLAVLMFLFSVAWPYTKQVATLVLWFTPTTRVPVLTRGRYLKWLDVLGKWSMIDVFVMIITFAAFRIIIGSPTLSFVPDNLYSVDMLVAPAWGLYANMIAQIVAQINSHFIVAYNKAVEKEAVKTHSTLLRSSFSARGLSDTNSGRVSNDKVEFGAEGEETALSFDDSSQEEGEQGKNISSRRDETKALGKEQFLRPHRGEDNSLVVKPYLTWVLGFSFIFICAMGVAGCLLTAVTFDTQGLIGVAIELGQDFEPARVEHSVISIAQLLMDQGRFLDTGTDKFGMAAIAALLVITTLIIPVVMAAALLCMWFKPMSDAQKERMGVFVDIMEAWQYLEVYILALIASAWQIGGVSKFFVNQYCGNLNQLFRELVFFDVLRAEDSQCFEVEASLRPAVYIQVAVALVLGVLALFVLKAFHQIEYGKRDKMLAYRIPSNVTLADGETEKEDIIDKIDPAPVLFTDRFRWMLTSPVSVLVDPEIEAEPY